MPRDWSPTDLQAAYASAPALVAARVQELLGIAQASGRLITIPTIGPAFGVVTDGVKRVLSVREHSRNARIGTLSYFPRNVGRGAGAQDRPAIEAQLDALGLPVPDPAANPGHVDLGDLRSLSNAAFDGVVRLIESFGPLPAFDTAEPPSALRQPVQVNRIIRDTAIVRRLKALYDNACQICGNRLTGSVPWWAHSEGHHVRPLGAPHNGSDTEDNILIVCPNHHALLDYGAIPLLLSQLALSQHPLSGANVDYHNDLYRARGAA